MQFVNNIQIHKHSRLFKNINIKIIAWSVTKSHSLPALFFSYDMAVTQEVPVVYTSAHGSPNVKSTKHTGTTIPITNKHLFTFSWIGIRITKTKRKKQKKKQTTKLKRLFGPTSTYEKYFVCVAIPQTQVILNLLSNHTHEVFLSFTRPFAA